MNLLLTQFFPNNNYTARNQNLLGQNNKLKKKIKSHDLSQSPPRGSNQASSKAAAYAEGQSLNLTNMKMRSMMTGSNQASGQNSVQ